jgi:hypothetical protein
MTRQVAGAMDVASIEPKQMSTGLARMSAMLSGKRKDQMATREGGSE